MRQRSPHAGAAGSGLDFQRASELADSLPHTANADSYQLNILREQPPRLLLAGLSVIHDFQVDAVISEVKVHTRG